MPISLKECMTASLAPRCNGSLSAPIAALTAEWRSDKVVVTTRAVKVEALKECSGVEDHRDVERLYNFASGFLTENHPQKDCGIAKVGRASTRFCPRRRRWS